MGNEFEVEVGVGVRPGEYAVRVVRSVSGGEPQSSTHLDVHALLERRGGLENAVLASAASARGGVVPEIERPLRQMGQTLFEAVFTGSIAETYRSSLAVARERGSKLRVVLRLTAPELSALPWEAMWDPELAAYVCRKEPLVRHVPAPFSPEPLPVEPPLRILGLVASPRDLAHLDVARERHHLDDALSAAIADGRVILDWLPEASWDGLQDRLLTAPWHVLHFIGHGDYDLVTDQGRVALVGEDGRADWVEAGRLADLLDEADPTPRLVVLNSCSSGQAGLQDAFSGTAAALVHGGISAVAAMQFRVSDPAAVAFPRGFYKALAAGRGVDAAMRSGRIAILGRGDSLEWVTPVLYLRGESTQLFSLTIPPAGHAGVPEPSSGDVATAGSSQDDHPPSEPFSAPTPVDDRDALSGQTGSPAEGTAEPHPPSGADPDHPRHRPTPGEHPPDASSVARTPGPLPQEPRGLGIAAAAVGVLWLVISVVFEAALGYGVDLVLSLSFLAGALLLRWNRTAGALTIGVTALGFLGLIVFLVAQSGVPGWPESLLVILAIPVLLALATMSARALGIRFRP